MSEFESANKLSLQLQNLIIKNELSSSRKSFAIRKYDYQFCRNQRAKFEGFLIELESKTIKGKKKKLSQYPYLSYQFKSLKLNPIPYAAFYHNGAAMPTKVFKRRAARRRAKIAEKLERLKLNS